MSGGKQTNEKNASISLEADQKIQDIKRQFGKEILEEAKKLAEKRAVESKLEEVTIEENDIMGAWAIIKRKR